MSKELIRWKRPDSDAGRKIETTLARLRTGGLQPYRHSSESEQRREPSEVFYASSPPSLKIVDLPRICAVHDRPYAARYIAGPGGRYQYSQTIKITDALSREQYADRVNHAGIDGADLSEESCPWCGGTGYGSVLCGKCRNEICYGKSTGRYFRCRTSCGSEGNMVQTPRRHQGITPWSRRGEFRL